jgi:hypothetical protein
MAGMTLDDPVGAVSAPAQAGQPGVIEVEASPIQPDAPPFNPDDYALYYIVVMTVSTIITLTFLGRQIWKQIKTRDDSPGS